MKKLLFLLLLLVALMPSLAQAQSFDPRGGGAVITSSGTATAAAPVLVEGAPATASFDLSGNMRVTLGTLLAGEDQNNNLIMTSGGVVRLVTIASAITTNTVSTTQIVPTGTKTFFGEVDGTGMVSVTLDLYGGFDSAASKVGKVWLCTIPLIGYTTVVDFCQPTLQVNFPYYLVESTLITGTSATAKVLAGL
jgi:hypothetical protein